jgi:mannose-6-phosphate isomerase
MTNRSPIHRIEPQFYPKIWGSPETAPWFAPRRAAGPNAEPIGEVWFPADDLLIKFLFTSQNLSVQVHPGDDYAARHENSRGKTEMWYILRAQPGARIALGFKHPLPADRLAAAARSGEIMNLLNWIEVQPGESYFVPAGTVHAIGAGLALCEIQQNSDVTYRLYDYGRDRELHLPQAQDVAHTGCHSGQSPAGEVDEGVELLVDSAFFATYRAIVHRSGIVAEGLGTRVLVVCEGTGLINGMTAEAGYVFHRNPAESVKECMTEWYVEPESHANSGPMKLLLIR